MKKAKKIIALLIVLLLSAFAAVMVALWEDPEETEEFINVVQYEGNEKNYILENEYLLLEMDAETTQFKVTVKESGYTWYSNPQTLAEDTIAMSTEKDRLNSTLLLTYSDAHGVDTLQDNYSYSIENKMFQMEEDENSLKVKYSIGDVEKEYVIPLVMEESRMNSILEQVDINDQMTVMDYYKKYDINKLGKKDNKEELLARYPIMEQEVIYALRDTARENIKKKLEDIFAAAGYTEEDYLADKEKDMSLKSSDKPVFNINVVYRLEEDELLVEIPFNEIEYKENFPIFNLSILPYFGAAGTAEEGFLLVPEGGGAMINFNNGKVAQSSYYADMYGWDMAQDREAVVNETATAFNVFGIANGEDSFLCVLEDGAPYASIRADISGRSNSFNYVNALYAIIHREKYNISDRYAGNMYVYEQGLNTEEKIVQRYCFVNSGKYTDMAAAYRDYLINNSSDAFSGCKDTQAPVMIEIVGALDKIGQVFGVPVSKPLELTTFEEAVSMISDLHSQGLQNMSVKLIGWMNGGFRQKILNSVKLVKELGKEEDLLALATGLKEKDIAFYLDGVTSYAYDSGLAEGFFTFTDAARLVSKEKVELFPYSTVTYTKVRWQDAYYLLKPEIMKEMVKNLAEVAVSYHSGISFRELGDDLSSDFSRKSRVTRQMAMNSQKEQLKELSAAGIPVMVNKGNNYVLPYVDMITNMNLGGTDYTIIDQKIPFYQMAIHGLVNYTGEAINLTQNGNEELLKSAEYGAGLAFKLMDESAFTLQNTLYTQYYGAEYASWREDIVEIYNRYNQELGHVFCQKMTGHEYLGETLTCTMYEDGTRVYVNYAYEDAVTETGVTIPARDYVVIR